MDKTFKHVLQRVRESKLVIPWYDRSTAINKGVPDYIVDNHVRIDVNRVLDQIQKEMEELKAERDILLGAVEFYAEKEAWCDAHYFIDHDIDGKQAYVIFQGDKTARKALEQVRENK